VPASPSIGTMQQPASATVGSSIADKATVSGGFNPTGTVTFTLFNNATASGTPLFTDTEPLVGGTATSAGYTTTATGTDYWVATYNGDADNNSVSGGAAAEPVTVTSATPSISTVQQPASATAGSSIADKATVAGGFNPTGTVTFTLFNNATASGTPLFTDTEPLVGGSATSAGYTTTATGTDYWVATYNGDADNSSVTSGTATEPVTVTPPPGDLKITNTGSPNPVVVSGQRLVYTIKATNTGGQDATNVTVTDTLPATVHFNSTTSTRGTCSRSTSSNPKTKDGQVTCTVGTLAGGASVTITIVVTATTPGTISAAATVTASNVTADADDTATATSKVNDG
jgi:uncharacterized repeat protein (TIGR01451 family)